MQEQVEMRPPPIISEFDGLQQHLRDLLERETLKSIDEVIELITKMYEQEKEPST